MAETYAALLRHAANDIDYARDCGHSTIPADEAAQVRALADLLERITPAMRHEVATLGGSLPRQATMRALRNILIDLAAGPQESAPELSPENPAHSLSEHLATLMECGEGLVSIGGDVYWINADDRAALRRALVPRDATSDGAIVWAAAKALSATQPRRAELLREIAARLGYGGGTPTGDTGEIATGPQGEEGRDGA